jgi:radical SAM protein with 4Fe4S-binding SPASM domain
VHCYLPDKDNVKDLKTKEIKELIDELMDSGCLFLTLTGGEIFLREDIFEIMEYIQKKEFVVQVFTNATLITNEVAKNLKEFGIWEIGISLYGVNADVHEKITQVKGSFDKTMAGIINLAKNNLPVRIKCPLVKHNFQEYKKVIKLAKDLGIKYTFDTTISPKLDGDKYPVSLRLGKDELNELFQDKEIYPTFLGSANYDKKEIILCQAGRNTCGISSFGDVYPCLQLPVPAGNIRENSFREIWRNAQFLKKLRKMDEKDIAVCDSCKMVFDCPRCPGLAYLEDGDLYGKSKACCEVAEIRRGIVPKKTFGITRTNSSV